MNDRAPPYDIAAERSLVASLMVDENLMGRISGEISARDFFREEFAWTFSACQALWDRDEAVNEVTVAHELDRQGRLEEIGGYVFLSNLITDLPTPVGAEDYAKLIKRDAVYRQMLEAAYKIQTLAYDAGPDLERALAHAETLVFGLRAGEKTEGFVHLREYLDGFLESDDQAPAPRADYHVHTGLSQLDALLGGLKPGNLIVVAARTSGGKTALMHLITRNAALVQNVPVAVFSLEMSGEEIAERLLSSEARVNSRRLRIGSHSEDEEVRVMQAHGVLAEAPILIETTTNLDISTLRAKARKLARDRGIGLVVVDYLQLLKSGVKFNANRVAEVGYITGALKELAGELGIPIVVGCQLNRQVEGRSDHRPVLSDLRESGSIEQDANVVLFIYQEASYVSRAEWERNHPNKVEEPYPEAQAELIVAKNRGGAKGTVHVRWREYITKFEDFDMAAAAPVQIGASL